MTTVTINEQDVVVTPNATGATVSIAPTTIEIVTTPGATSFLGLLDTPDTYVAQGGKLVSVKSDASGLEFISSSSVGVTDHGALTGLPDDDHPQYHNDVRGDARYWPLSTDLATQAELNAHEADTTSVHGIVNTAALVLNSRTLTINSVTFDLSADRSWTITAGGSPFIGANDSAVPLIARGFSPAQSGNLEEWQASDLSVQAFVNPRGGAQWKGHSAIGADAAINDASLIFPPISANVVLSIQETLTDFDMYQAGGIVNLIVLDPPADTGSYSYGMDNEVATEATNTHDIGGMYALYGGAFHYGSGELGDLEALSFSVANLGSGVVDYAAGIAIYVQNVGGGSITEGVALEIGAVSGDSAYAIRTSGGAHRFGDYLDIAEISAPAAPSNTHGRLFCRDVAGKSQLCVRFATGAVQVLATEP